MTTLPHQLDRTIVIEAPPATVFKYFTDPARWAAWWGAGSTIDARPGGRVLMRYPDGTEVAGDVVEVTPPSRIVFTYGYVKGTPIAPGGSRVTIRLEPAARGTRLHLAHAFAEAAVRDHHVQGWRYQLSLFANVVADEIARRSRRAGGRVVRGVGGARRGGARAQPRAIAAPGVRMRDRFSCVEGAEELTLHIGAAQRFMPGMRLTRTGGRAALPGHGAGRLDGRGPGRRAQGPGHQRVHARSRRTDRIGNRLLGIGTDGAENR